MAPPARSLVHGWSATSAVDSSMADLLLPFVLTCPQAASLYPNSQMNLTAIRLEIKLNLTSSYFLLFFVKLNQDLTLYKLMIAAAAAGMQGF